MTDTTRRNIFKACLIGTVASPFSSVLTVEAASKNINNNHCVPFIPKWSQGIEGQRNADLRNGTYLNPIMPGDHPDPTVLKDGEDYYMTFSSFNSYPGIVIWHSKDLVNWSPVTAAFPNPCQYLHKNLWQKNQLLD